MWWSKSHKEEVLNRRVSELEARIHELEVDLIHDPLTGLKTRTFFEEEAARSLSLISRSEKSTRKELFGFKNLSIVFFDIDHFKNVNDTYGHQAGDHALRKVASAIEQSVREGDTVARWGGEEFIVLLLGAPEVDAAKKADEIRQKISELSFEFHQGFHLTISAGVAHAEKGMFYETLLKRADDALYRAKDTGRNKVVPYSRLT